MKRQLSLGNCLFYFLFLNQKQARNPRQYYVSRYFPFSKQIKTYFKMLKFKYYLCSNTYSPIFVLSNNEK